MCNFQATITQLYLLNQPCVLQVLPLQYSSFHYPRCNSHLYIRTLQYLHPALLNQIHEGQKALVYGLVFVLQLLIAVIMQLQVHLVLLLKFLKIYLFLIFLVHGYYYVYCFLVLIANSLLLLVQYFFLVLIFYILLLFPLQKYLVYHLYKFLFLIKVLLLLLIFPSLRLLVYLFLLCCYLPLLHYIKFCLLIVLLTFPN